MVWTKRGRVYEKIRGRIPYGAAKIFDVTQRRFVHSVEMLRSIVLHHHDNSVRLASDARKGGFWEGVFREVVSWEFSPAVHIFVVDRGSG